MVAGVGSEEFWNLTPADILLVLNAYERREHSAYWRAGLITATIINVNRRKGSKAVKPEDFVPKIEPVRPNKTRGQRQTDRSMALMLQHFTVALGGEVTRT